MRMDPFNIGSALTTVFSLVFIVVGFNISPTYTICITVAGFVVVMLHMCCLPCADESKRCKRLVIGLDISCK